MADQLQFRKDIAEAEREVRRAEKAWLVAKKEAKDAKEYLDSAVLKLRDLAAPEDDAA